MVLEGTFFYDVDAETLQWALEGDGAHRRLVISLDKAEPNPNLTLTLTQTLTLPRVPNATLRE